MIGVWFNLIQYIVEDFRVNESFGTLCLRTEAACQIADTRDLNIYFFERFQLGSPFCLGGRTIPPAFCDPANMRHPYYIGLGSPGKLFSCSGLTPSSSQEFHHAASLQFMFE